MTQVVLMNRPLCFSFDPQTADSNAFQNEVIGKSDELVMRLAREEFDGLAGAVTEAGVRVVVSEDRVDRETPDSVFPNNWLSFHSSGEAVMYPMLAPMRRTEVRPEVVDMVERTVGARWPRRIDLSGLAEEGVFLEGTGSLVIDPLVGVAFACRSVRTSERGLDVIEGELGIETVRFDAADEDGVAYYHTNVMLSVGPGVVIVCAESIAEGDRERVMDRLRVAGREIVEISRGQVRDFAGNALSLRNDNGDPLVVMSARALGCLSSPQRATIERAGRIVSAPLPTIERVGGGSARCMISEIHLPS